MQEDTFNISRRGVDAIDGADIIITLQNFGYRLTAGSSFEVERRFWFDVGSLPRDGEFLAAEMRVFKVRGDFFAINASYLGGPKPLV